ncbi:malto-oligosyltrehalose trehalohydrolase [Prosthecomicrobium sp. N25]|uniref:malto-oligosyltrehalose trehalohydrolase n=1 Tax=Prosthecomicrobium sp. N25 TaxID=3129254 RepID=UPI0030774BCA
MGAAPPVDSDLRLGVTRFGPRVQAEGTLFRLWAPSAPAVELVLANGTLPMAARGGGWFDVLAPGTGPGARYRFRIGDRDWPDPASRLQEGGPDGWSVVPHPSLAWRSRRLGRPWAEMVISELHVGTATPEGTFRALAKRLGHYAEAGVTAIQLMPVAEFAGSRGWGYDGVLPFAVKADYGRPEDLAELVRRAHTLGLSVFLDVVYNHFGPTGNGLETYAPEFFAAGVLTPWGPAIDFERPEVRRFFIENARGWVENFGIDGLRFDAVHAFQGPARAVFLRELAETLNALEPRPHLVLENEHNEASLLGGAHDVAAHLYRAQWNDDFHHVFHVAVTGESDGYYAAYAEGTAARVARVLQQGFDYQGDPNPLRGGVPRGEVSAGLHPTAFVSFLQNHDQVGNRAFGERLTDLAPPEAVRLLRFALLLAPQVPMLFMGEEYDERRPFRFFCDFEGDLAEAVRSGRRAEFAQFAAFAGTEIPDPLDPATRDACRLDWARLDTPEGAEAFAFTRRCLQWRRRFVTPLLGSAFRGAEAGAVGPIVVARWDFEAGSYGLALNLSPATRFARVPAPRAEAAAGEVRPGSGHWVFESFSGALWLPQ